MFNSNNQSEQVDSSDLNSRLQADTINDYNQNNELIINNTRNNISNSTIVTYYNSCLHLCNKVIFYVNIILWILFSIGFNMFPLLLFPMIKISILCTDRLNALKISGIVFKIIGAIAIILSIISIITFSGSLGSNNRINTNAMFLYLAIVLVIVGVLEYLSGIYFNTEYERLNTQIN